MSTFSTSLAWFGFSFLAAVLPNASPLLLPYFFRFLRCGALTAGKPMPGETRPLCCVISVSEGTVGAREYECEGKGGICDVSTDFVLGRC